MLLTSYTSTFAELAFILDSCSNQQSPPERQPQAALQHGSPLPRGDVPLLSEININPCLQRFCDFTKKKICSITDSEKASEQHQASLYNYTFGTRGQEVCWVVHAAKTSLGWPTSCLWPHSFLLAFQASKIFEREALRSVSARYPSWGLPEITEQHRDRKQLREAEGLSESCHVIAQFIRAD